MASRARGRAKPILIALAAVILAAGVAVAIVKRSETSRAAAGSSSCVDAGDDVHALNGGPERAVQDVQRVDLRTVGIRVDSATLKLTFHLGGDVVPQDTADDSGTTDVSATMHYSEKGLYYVELRP